MKIINHIIPVFLIIIVLAIIEFEDTNSTKEYYNPKNHNIKLDSGKVQLIIEPEFDEYLLNQIVCVKVLLKNMTDKNYSIHYPLSLDIFRYNIFDPFGNTLHYPLTSDLVSFLDSIKLISGETIEKYFCLDGYFSSYKNVPGGYRISADFQGIKSNEIKIVITIPTSDNKKVYNLTYGADYYPRNQREISYLSGIIRRYPKSKYIPQLYNGLILSSGHRDSNSQTIEYVNNYFKEHSDSYGSVFIISKYERYLRVRLGFNVEQTKQILLFFAEKYKNSLTGKLVNIEIERNYSDKMFY